MAITKVYRVAPQEGQIHRIGERSYMEMWNVESDRKDELPIDVFFATGLPRWGDGCGWDLDCEVTGVFPMQSRIRKETWHVRVEYGPRRDFTWRFRVSSAPYRLTLPLDVEGKPILNSAGDPYEKRADRETPITVIQLRREQETFDSTWIGRFVGTLNQNSLWGSPEDSIKLDSLMAEERKYGDNSSWTVHVTLMYHPLLAIRVANQQGVSSVEAVSPWHDIRLDAGLYHWVETTVSTPEFDQQGVPIGELSEKRFVRLPILDGARQPVRKPVPLDGFGKALYPNGLDAGKTAIDIFNDSVFNVFRKHLQADWSEFDFPT